MLIGRGHVEGKMIIATRVRATRMPLIIQFVMGDSLNFIVWNRATLEYLRDHGRPNDFELLTSSGKQGKKVLR
jgi:hypothetical protein